MEPRINANASAHGLTRRLRRGLSAFLVIITFAAVVFSTAGLIATDPDYEDSPLRKLSTDVAFASDDDNKWADTAKWAINKALGRCEGDPPDGAKDKCEDNDKKDKTSPENWITNDEDSEASKEANSVIRNEFDNGFGSLIYRTLFFNYYMNPNSDFNDTYSWNEKPCNSIDSDTSGQLENDNCDVPGFGTEFFQDMLNSAAAQGMGSGSLKKQAKLAWNIGIADYLLPTDCVPVVFEPNDTNKKNASNLSEDSENKCGYVTAYSGSNRYTALEQLGYNLSWTNYNGEWDYIKVNSDVRYSTSITFAEAAGAFFSSVGETVSETGSALAHGDFATAVDHLLHPLRNIASKTINRVLNRIEENIFWRTLPSSNDEKTEIDRSHQTQRWYRPDFIGKTMYGAYEISSDMAMTIAYVASNDISEQAVNDQVAQRVGYSDDQEKKDREEAAFPEREAKKDEDGKVVKKDGHEVKESFDDWLKRNKDKVKWAKENLGIDPESYKKKADKDADIFTMLKKDWATSIDKYIAEKKAAVAETQKNVFDDIVQKQVQEKLQDKLIDDFLTDMSRTFCTDSNGNPIGEIPNSSDRNIALNKVIEKGLVPALGRPAYDYNVNTKKWDWKCGDVKTTTSGSKGVSGQAVPRPTITGAMFGSSASSESESSHVDTRRSAYNILGRSNGSDFSTTQFMLGVSQKITMALNFLIGLSFQPILKETGMSDLAKNLIEAFRDTIYMNLVMAFVAIAAFMVLLHFFKRGTKRNFIELGEIVLIVMLTIGGLSQPDLIFKMIDDIPTAVERSLLAVVFSDDGSDKLCTATGTPKNTTASVSGTVESLFGKSTADSINADAQVRVMQCKIWEVYVLAPWSYGQFGVGINQLYANGYAYEGGDNGSAISTDGDVTSLVGDAAVYMGGGKVVHNWGIYQLRHLLSGTATNDDKLSTVGVVDKNLYRLVDLQAGPNNASGRESGYFGVWKGNAAGRFMVALTAIPASLLGLLGIGRLAICKIKWTITCLLMIILTPFMRLLGTLPGSSRKKMIEWEFAILALCIKRVVAVCFMGIMIQFVLATTQSGMKSGVASAAEASSGVGGGATWSTVALSLIVLGYLFWKYGDDLLNLFTAQIDSKAAEFNNQWTQAMMKARQQAGGPLVQNAIRSAGIAVRAGVSTTAASIVMNDRNEDTSTMRLSRYKAREQNRINAANVVNTQSTQTKLAELSNKFRDGQIDKSRYEESRQALMEAFNEKNRELNDAQRRLDVINGTAANVKPGEKLAAMRYVLDGDSYKLTSEDGIDKALVNNGSMDKMGDLARTQLNRLQTQMRMKGQSPAAVEIMKVMRENAEYAQMAAAEKVAGRGAPLDSVVQRQSAPVDENGNPIAATAYENVYDPANADIDYAKLDAISKEEKTSKRLSRESAALVHQLESYDPASVTVALLANENIAMEEINSIISMASAEQLQQLQLAMSNVQTVINEDGAALPGNYAVRRTNLHEARRIISDIAGSQGVASVNDLRIADSMASASLYDDAVAARDQALATIYSEDGKEDNAYLDAIKYDYSSDGRKMRRRTVLDATKKRAASIKNLDDLMKSDNNQTGLTADLYDLKRQDIERDFRDTVEGATKSHAMQLGWADHAMKKQQDLDAMLKAGKIDEDTYAERSGKLNDAAKAVLESETAISELSKRSNEQVLAKKLLFEHPELAKENPALAARLEGTPVSKSVINAVTAERRNAVEATAANSHRDTERTNYHTRGEKLGEKLLNEKIKATKTGELDTLQKTLAARDELLAAQSRRTGKVKAVPRMESEKPEYVSTKRQRLEDLFKSVDRGEDPRSKQDPGRTPTNPFEQAKPIFESRSSKPKPSIFGGGNDGDNGSGPATPPAPIAPRPTPKPGPTPTASQKPVSVEPKTLTPPATKPARPAVQQSQSRPKPAIDVRSTPKQSPSIFATPSSSVSKPETKKPDVRQQIDAAFMAQRVMDMKKAAERAEAARRPQHVDRKKPSMPTSHASRPNVDLGSGDKNDSTPKPSTGRGLFGRKNHGSTGVGDADFLD